MHWPSEVFRKKAFLSRHKKVTISDELITDLPATKELYKKETHKLYGLLGIPEMDKII